jgi:hypothetical protein
MITCRRCSSVLPEHARFCGYCGGMVREQEHVLTALLDSNRTALLTRPPVALDDDQTLWEPISDADLSAIVMGEEMLLDKQISLPELDLPLLLSEEDWSTQLLTSGDFPTVAAPQEGGPLPASHDQALFSLQPVPSAAEDAAQSEASVALAERETQALEDQDKAQPVWIYAVSRQAIGRVIALIKDRYGYKPAHLITAISAAVVIAAVVASLVIVLQSRVPNGASTLPSLFISGSAVPGKTVTLVGNNFTPNSKITITFDNQSATTLSPTSLTQSSLRTHAMTLLQAFNQQQPLAGISTTVGNDGSFSVTLPISASWSIGSTHIIDVYDQSAKLIASKSFTTVANPAPGLAYCDSTLTQEQVNLGPIPAGNPQPASLTFTLCAQGNVAVNWVDSWNQKQDGWLQLPQNGQIPIGTQSQQLNITASAANLNPGTYKTAVVFSSHVSDVKVVLNVTFTVAVPKTCLQVNQPTLGFTVVEGVTVTSSQPVIVTNCGDYGKWSVATSTDDGNGWLNVSPGNGALSTHGSQGINIGTSPGGLGPGTYTGHVTFGIGPAKTTVTVSLSVLAPTPTPVPPTPTPTPVPPTPTPTPVPPTPTPIPVTPTPVPIIPTPTPVPVQPTPVPTQPPVQPTPVPPTPTPVQQPTQQPNPQPTSAPQPTSPPVPTQPPVQTQPPVPTPTSVPTQQLPVPTTTQTPIDNPAAGIGQGHRHQFGG